MNLTLNSNIIEIKNLKKHFKEVKALDGISLKIRKGELFSILGPNGAGKTTLVRILTTILTPSSGDALIKDFSILTNKNDIVKIIGVCPQNITIYEALRAEENVEFIAYMHGMSKRDAKEKAKKLLDDFGISGRKDWSKHFSGGMQRRLNLAMALISEPEILFLDEPTAGLDPQARRLVWDYIHELKKKNMTIILMTHDMFEADMLSDRIAIIDHGKIIAKGTPNELKEKYGSDNTLEISFTTHNEIELVKRNIKEMPFVTNSIETNTNGSKTLMVSFKGGLKNLVEIIQRGFNGNNENVEDLRFRQNSLEDVFLNLTGRRLRD